ncbi:MAG: 6-phosphogluconolactonase [Myxococcota bacterium]|nr:6-phosphogluconolactonase [Myxococcota bacterium]
MAVRRHADLAALARAMADELPALVRRSLDETSACHFALSGGNTPRALYQELVARGRAFLPWDRIDLWWGDERCVPPDHPESNFGMAKAELIQPLNLDSSRWHRMHGEDEPAAAAQAYEDHIYGCLGSSPVFTVAFLGIGDDGHTASLFPGGAIDLARIVIAAKAPSGQPRLSMTPKLINAARHVRFLVAGASKAEALAGIVNGTSNAPARLIENGDLQWLVDEGAAKGI